MHEIFAVKFFDFELILMKMIINTLNFAADKSVTVWMNTSILIQKAMLPAKYFSVDRIGNQEI
jgi:hypothetical protein